MKRTENCFLECTQNESWPYHDSCNNHNIDFFLSKNKQNKQKYLELPISLLCLFIGVIYSAMGCHIDTLVDLTWKYTYKEEKLE